MYLCWFVLKLYTSNTLDVNNARQKKIWSLTIWQVLMNQLAASCQVGEVVTVRKHSSMGCAVVSMTDTRVRQAGLVAETVPYWCRWTNDDQILRLTSISNLKLLGTRGTKCHQNNTSQQNDMSGNRRRRQRMYYQWTQGANQAAP